MDVLKDRAVPKTRERKRSPALVSAIIVLALGLAIGGCQAKELTTEQKVADFRYLYRIFKENHPFLDLKARVEGYDWLAHEKEFEDMVRSTKDDAEFAAVMKRITALVNNAHTSLLPSVTSYMRAGGAYADAVRGSRAPYWADLAGDSEEPALLMPFLAVYHTGHYVVVDADVAVQESGVVPGATVTRVDGVDVHEYVAGFRGQTWLKYDPIRARVYLPKLLSPDAASTVQVEFRRDDGTLFEKTLTCRAGPGAWRYWRPPQYTWPSGQQRSLALTDTIRTSTGVIGYIHVRSMDESIVKACSSFLRSAGPFEAIVIDIRGNGGGSDMAWMGLTRCITAGPLSGTSHALMKSGEYMRRFFANLPTVTRQQLVESLPEGSARNLPPELQSAAYRDPIRLTYAIGPSPDSISFEGPIYLLVDDVVYSSAESFALHCKTTGWATIVGGFTGGDGGGTGPLPLVLPNSGLTLRFPAAMALGPSGKADEEEHVIPDVLVEPSIPEFLASVEALQESVHLDPVADPVLKECVRLIDEHTAKGSKGSE